MAKYQRKGVNLPTLNGSFTQVVVQGATGSTARPSSTGTVLWIGSATPANALTDDLWWDSTVKIIKHYNGTTWELSGAASYPPILGGRSGSLFGGLPVVATRANGFGNAQQSNGTDTSATYRFVGIVRTAAADLRLVYANWSGGSDGPNTITVKASVEPPTSGSVTSGASAANYPVTFGGAPTVTIAPGGFAVSDPVPVRVAVGQWLYHRTYVSVASAGQKWPIGTYLSTGLQGSNEGTLAGSDVTAATPPTNTIPSNSGAGYGPVAIIGIPTTPPGKCVAIDGDSIYFGSGEFLNDRGMAVRACDLQGIPYVQLAKPGEHGYDFVGVGQRQRMPLAAGCTHAVEGYGRNDYAAGQTAAQLQATRISIWTDLASRGIKVYAGTNPPKVTSTDAFVTTVNQTTFTTGVQESARLTVNAWLRDGAPMLNGAPAATGSNAPGTLRAGSAGHPLTDVWDVSAAIETSLNSGIWKGPTRSFTDGAMTSGTVTLTSATAAFTAADVGQSIYIAGAGAAGAALVTQIKTVANATTITVEGGTASTTVSGATVYIGVPTTDGVHPTATLAIAAAAIAPTFT